VLAQSTSESSEHGVDLPEQVNAQAQSSKFSPHDWQESTLSKIVQSKDDVPRQVPF